MKRNPVQASNSNLVSYNSSSSKEDVLGFFLDFCLQSKNIDLATQENILRVIACYQYIKENLEMIGRAVNNKEKLSTYSNLKDMQHGVLRDYNRTSFHIKTYENAEDAKKQLLEHINSIEATIIQLRQNPETLTAFANQFTYHRDRGCLEERTAAAIQYAAAIQSIKDSKAEFILNGEMLSISAQFNGELNHDWFLAVAHFRDKVGKFCLTPKDEIAVFTLALLRIYFIETLYYTEEDFAAIPSEESEPTIIPISSFNSGTVKDHCKAAIKDNNAHLKMGLSGMIQIWFHNKEPAEELCQYLKAIPSLQKMHIKSCRVSQENNNGHQEYVLRLSQEQYHEIFSLDGFEIFSSPKKQEKILSRTSQQPLPPRNISTSHSTHSHPPLKKSDSVHLQQNRIASSLDEQKTSLLTALENPDIDPEIIQALLDAGADVDDRDQFGRNALLLASKSGNSEVVECILNHIDEKIIFKDMTLNHVCSQGYNALGLACLHGQVNVVKLLLERGFDPFSHPKFFYSSAIEIALVKKKVVITQLLLTHNLENTKNAYRPPMLNLAISNGDNDAVRFLIETFPYDGPGLLLLAAKSGYVSIVNILLEKKCSPNVPIYRGSQNPHYNYCYFAIISAAEENHYHVINALIQYGASQTVRNDAGDTALHLAIRFQHRASVDVLINKISPPDLYTLLSLRNNNKQTILDELISGAYNTSTFIKIIEKISPETLYSALQKQNGKANLAKTVLLRESTDGLIEIVKRLKGSALLHFIISAQALSKHNKFSQQKMDQALYQALISNEIPANDIANILNCTEIAVPTKIRYVEFLAAVNNRTLFDILIALEKSPNYRGIHFSKCNPQEPLSFINEHFFDFLENHAADAERETYLLLLISKFCPEFFDALDDAIPYKKIGQEAIKHYQQRNMNEIITKNGSRHSIDEPNLARVIETEGGLALYADLLLLRNNKNLAHEMDLVLQKIERYGFLTSSLRAAPITSIANKITYRLLTEVAPPEMKSTEEEHDQIENARDLIRSNNMLIKMVKPEDWDNYIKQLTDPAVRNHEMRMLKKGTHKFHHLTGEIKPYRKGLPNIQKTRIKKNSTTLLYENETGGVFPNPFGIHQADRILVGLLFNKELCTVKAMMTGDRGTYGHQWIGSEEQVKYYQTQVEKFNYTDAQAFIEKIKGSNHHNEVLAETSKEAIIGLVVSRENPEDYRLALKRQEDLQKKLNIMVPIFIQKPGSPLQLYPKCMAELQRHEEVKARSKLLELNANWRYHNWTINNGSYLFFKKYPDMVSKILFLIDAAVQQEGDKKATIWFDTLTQVQELLANRQASPQKEDEECVVSASARLKL